MALSRVPKCSPHTSPERVSIELNRKRALAFVSGRIFCGKPPPKSAIADLGDIDCRSRVDPRSVSAIADLGCIECRSRVDPRSVPTPDQVRGRLFPENAVSPI